MTPPRAWLRPPWFVPLLLGGVVVATYWNSLHGEFLYDDAAWVVNNPAIRSLWPLVDVVQPPAHLGISGRPLTSISFAISHALGGRNPVAYHACNIAIHLGAVLALWGLLRRAFRSASLRPRLGVHAEAAAAFGALLWAAHPLNTIVVSYISQRSESLMALSYLLTLYAFARAQEERKTLWLGVSVAACFAGMCCKESMLTAPIVVLLYEWAIVGVGFRAALRRHTPYYAVLAASWLLVGWLMIGLSGRGVGHTAEVTAWNYALTQTKALCTYLRLAGWPAPLIFDRGMRVFQTLREAAPYAAGLLGLVALFVWLARRQHALAFAGAAVALVLAPSSSVVPIVFQPIGENRAYLPAVFLIGAGVGAAFYCLGRRAAGVAAVATVALATLAVARNRIFQDEIQLWSHVEAAVPGNPRGFYNLGVALEHRGRVDAALAHYAHAAALDPRHAKARNNLGALQLQRGERDAAMANYQAALALDPNFVEAHTNFATALTQLQRYDEAIAHYRRAIELAPGLSVPHRLLGQALLNVNQPDAAAEEFARAVAIDPRDVDAHHSLGLIAYSRGDFAAAIRQFETALTLSPDAVQPVNNLAATLIATRRFDEAIATARRALARHPDNPDVHFNLAAGLLQLGRYAEAAAELETSLRLNPQQAEAHNDLGVCFQKLGRLPEAIAAFTEALRLNPRFDAARQNLANAQAALERAGGTAK